MHREPGKRNRIDKALKPIWIQAPNKSLPWNYIAGLHQVWRQITAQLVLTQEEIPEEGG